MKLPLQVNGSGVSGLASEFVVPEWQIGLDCGLGLPHARRTRITFITHGHLDHIGGVARHAYIRKMTQQPPSLFVVSPEIAPLLREHIAWWSTIQRSRPALCEFIELSPRERFNLKDYYEIANTCERFAVAQETFHTIPSQGYVFLEKRRKLLPEHKEKSSIELKELRESGEPMYEWINYPVLGYTGDTTIKALTEPNNLFVLSNKLVVECTYLDNTVSTESAKARGHIHLDSLLEIVDSFECQEIMLTHFSQRHTQKDIERALIQLKDKAPHINFTASQNPKDLDY